MIKDFTTTAGDQGPQPCTCQWRPRASPGHVHGDGVRVDHRVDQGLSRNGSVADIWDNNTVPLASTSGSPWLTRAGRARAGLRWMAGPGADRRDLMIDLNAALDAALPTAEPAPSVRLHVDLLIEEHAEQQRQRTVVQQLRGLGVDRE